MRYETLWTFHTANFRVTLECAPDDDYENDVEDDGTTAENLESGLWTAYQFKVAVYDALGHEIGADYLGGSIYENPCDFMDHRACGRANRDHAAAGRAGRCGSYFRDMIGEAVTEARRNYNAPRAYLRAA